MTVEIRSRAPEETRALGEALGRVLLRAGAPGAVVALSGPLGAGKTCFVQGLARGLGVSGPVRSPTFVLIAEYRGAVPFYHVDLYRLDAGEADGLGLEELLDGPGVVAIEWADRAGPVLPAERLEVALAYADGENERVVRVSARDARYAGVAGAFEACASSR